MCKWNKINHGIVVANQKLDDQMQEYSFTRYIQQWFENTESIVDKRFDLCQQIINAEQEEEKKQEQWTILDIDEEDD